MGAPLDRDWQVRYIGRNYALAIAILAMLAIASFASMQLAIEAQSRHVALGLLSSRQAELLNRVQTGVRRLVQHAADPTVREGDVHVLQARLLLQVEEFRAAQTRYLDLLAEPDPLPGFDLSARLLEIYRGPPYTLAETLDTALDRIELIARQDIRTVRTLETSWTPLDIGLASGVITLSAFEKSMDLIDEGSRRYAKRLSNVHVAITSVTLLVLAGEVLLIFGPLVRRLRAHNGMLEEKQARLDRLAYTDTLTGIGNRAAFQRDLEASVAAGRPFALMVFDLDRFKAINDGFGHQAGDDLLATFATRLSQAAPAGARLSRLGGDEFAVVAPNLADERTAEAEAERLLARLVLPWRRGAEDVEIASSIGVALFPLHATEADPLHGAADEALYKAKGSANRVAVFDAALAERRDHAARLIKDCGRAFAGEFEVHYQPEVRSADGRTLGFEALVRWRHPELGLLPPAEFLPAIARAGRMAELTRHVLDRACADLARLRREHGFDGHVAVNMPEALLANAAGADTVLAALDRHGLPGRALVLEVTEDVLVNRAASAIEGMLEALSGRGIRVALDDFGTGFASLTHLRTLPFDTIKIDRRFVWDLGRSEASEAIVRSMTGLALALGKHVVAEGVETRSQLAFLRSIGCTAVQGFLVARPLGYDDLLNWIQGTRVHQSIAGQPTTAEVVRLRPMAASPGE